MLGPPVSPSQEHTGDGPGLVYCHALATWDEPSLEERERAILGFQTGISSHTKVIRLERNALLGKGMDLNSLTWLLVTCVFFQNVHNTNTDSINL